MRGAGVARGGRPPEATGDKEDALALGLQLGNQLCNARREDLLHRVVGEHLRQLRKPKARVAKDL